MQNAKSCEFLPGEQRTKAEVARKLPQVRLAIERVQYNVGIASLRLHVVPVFDSLVKRRPIENLEGEQRCERYVRTVIRPVRGRGMLIEQIGEGCGKTEHLTLIVF